MRLALIVLLLVFLVPILVVQTGEAACEKACTGECCKKKSNAEITEFIRDTKEGRAENRRVEFKILNKEQLKRQKR